MKLSFNLKLSQSLKLTPLLQQSIKLLHASQSELNQLIEDYVNDNIFLELEEESVSSSNSQINFNNSKEITFKNDYSYELFDTEIKNQTLKEYLIDNLSIFSFSDIICVVVRGLSCRLASRPPSPVSTRFLSTA